MYNYYRLCFDEGSDFIYEKKKVSEAAVVGYYCCSVSEYFNRFTGKAETKAE